MRTYLLKALLVAVAFASAGSARAEVLVQPAYNPCEYARNQIKNANTYNIGGIVGDNWLQAALCQTTAEACTDLGSLCASGVGYDELDQLCSPGNQLRICVPKDSIGDEDGVCVAFTDGCPANAGICEKAGCSFKDWSPIPEPVPDVGGNRVPFIGAVYERPEACVYEHDNDGSPACQGDPQIGIPPPPPTEHPCDEYPWGSKEWWCCVDPLSSECGPGDIVGLVTCETKYPNDPQKLACCKDPDLPGCNVVSTGGTTTGGSGTGGSGTGGIVTGGSGTGGTGTGGSGSGGEGSGTGCGGTSGGDTGCDCGPEIPGTPEGNESPNPGLAAGECLVTPQDTEAVNGKLIGVTKEGTGISLLIEYRAPEGLAGDHSEIVQTAGPAVSMSGPSGIAFAANSSWTVQLGRPEKMYGEFIPNAAFLVTVYDAEGKILHQAACEEKAGLHTQGGSGGCSFLPAGPVPASGWTALILLLSSFGIGLVRCRRN